VSRLLSLSDREAIMVITLTPELEAAVKEAASRQGIAPDALALNALRERFLPTKWPIEPRDDWERRLLDVGTDCGVSLSNDALSREALYE
jgi:hypothetical protein